MEGEWPCYRGGKFNGGSGHVTEVARLRENGHVTEVVTLIEGEWSCYRGDHFNEGEWSYYRGGQFKAGGMVMLQRW